MVQRPVNAFTVDVEDYFHVTGFEPHIRRDEWGSFPCRVVQSTHRILELLARYDVKATFFTLGWVAERYPGLVADIDAGGHEIGSHTYWHKLIYRQSPAEFREDLRRSCDAIAQVTGKAIKAFRAPSFSITRRSLWALDILAEEGIEIDSSIFPCWHNRYGVPEAPPEPHMVETGSGTLYEIPPAVLRVGGFPVPSGGGAYFRLMPYWLTESLLARINRTRPFVFYVHPWEIDPGQPRLQVGKRSSRMRHYHGLTFAENKLDRLLSRFAFSTLGRLAMRPSLPDYGRSVRLVEVLNS